MKAELQAVLDRLRAKAGEVKPQAFGCETCEDVGLLWIREKGERYAFWGTLRCPCGTAPIGTYKRNKHDSETVKGPRAWDSQIPSAAPIPRDEVFSLSQRMAYEHEAEEERLAIQEHGG